MSEQATEAEDGYIESPSQVVAYRIDWNPGDSIGRQRFYGVSEKERMRRHILNAVWPLKIVALGVLSEQVKGENNGSSQ